MGSFINAAKEGGIPMIAAKKEIDPIFKKIAGEIGAEYILAKNKGDGDRQRHIIRCAIIDHFGINLSSDDRRYYSHQIHRAIGILEKDAKQKLRLDNNQALAVSRQRHGGGY